MPNDQNTPGTIGAVVPVSSDVVEEQLIRQDQIIQQLLNRMNQYEDTVKLLTETMAENPTVKTRIVELEKLHTTKPAIETQPKEATKNLNTPPQPQANNNPTTSYVTVAATNSTKPALPRRQTKPIPLERAARLFTAPSPTHGFKFVCLPQKGRASMGKIRKSLTSINVNNARVLHVHFPARNICGLLIHTDFEQTLFHALQIAGITPINNFYPEDPAILSNPALQSLPLEEKADIVTEMIHQTRCMRITARAPKHVQAALAYHFISSGIFTRTDLNNYRYPSNSNTTNEQDIHMFETNVSEAEEPQWGTT
ncbi:hypothetical protein G6F42_020424 [Rhizopus arrhizus]|nr:hypothetical protein G6F42_020424 [Rhizopus arrhizus]